MPYEVVKRGAKWCVVKKDGGAKIGCHSSPKGAHAQIQAIYASEGKK